MCVCVYSYPVTRFQIIIPRVYVWYIALRRKKNKCVCVQFNVIPLSAIENCPSVARIHAHFIYTHTHTQYTHVRIELDGEIAHISVATHTQKEKTLSSATYVFIKNSANGLETAISICNAVNNFPPADELP